MRLSLSVRLVTACLAVVLLPTSGSAIWHGADRAAQAAVALPIRVTTPAACTPPCLWDATTHAVISYTSSSDYGTHFPTVTDQAADDFQVTPDVFWHVVTATVPGQYIDGSSTTLKSALVQIYADNGNNLPGGQPVYDHRYGTDSIGGLSTGTLVFTISPPLFLSAGHYWFSVQAEWPVTSIPNDGTQWVWNESTQQQLGESVWRQPGDSYGSGCITWAPRLTVCHRPSLGAPDMAFKLEGILTQISNRLFLPVLSR